MLHAVSNTQLLSLKMDSFTLGVKALMELLVMVILRMLRYPERSKGSLTSSK